MNSYMNFFLYGCSIFFISVLMYGCMNDRVSTDMKNEVAVNTDYTLELDAAQDLPTLLEVAQIFKHSELQFIDNLTNSKENISKYNTKYAQKLNFGVYSADLAYCIINKKTQRSIEYLFCLSTLSNELWMTDIYNIRGLNQRLESSNFNNDTLVSLLAEMQKQLDFYLADNMMSYSGVVVFAGAWIETVYIAFGVGEMKKDDKLNQLLFEQGKILQNLIMVLNKIDEKSDFVELISDLEKINSHFIKKNKINSTMFTEDEIKDLSYALIRLRTKIVS